MNTSFEISDIHSSKLAAPPKRSKVATQSPTKKRRSRDPDPHLLQKVHSAAQFARCWLSDEFKSLQLTPQEQDDMFSERMGDELADKMNKLELYSAQIEEHREIIQNFHEMDDLAVFVEYTCDDTACKWDKVEHRDALLPNEVLHVMIYHSAGLSIALL